MRSRRKTAACGLALLLFFTICGCAARRQTGEWFAMDTVMTATVYGSADALEAAEAETYRLDALLAAQKDGSEIAAVLAHGCDTLVTADLKYHEFADAQYLGLNLIDAGHFQTEDPVCARMKTLLTQAYPELTVLRSQNHGDRTHFL